MARARRRVSCAQGEGPLVGRRPRPRWPVARLLRRRSRSGAAPEGTARARTRAEPRERSERPIGARSREEPPPLKNREKRTHAPTRTRKRFPLGCADGEHLDADARTRHLKEIGEHRLRGQARPGLVHLRTLRSSHSFRTKRRRDESDCRSVSRLSGREVSGPPSVGLVCAGRKETAARTSAR